MKALVICPTIGRVPYLNRMLSSFTNQTYDDKHLVVVNDDKHIQICCDRSDVTVINCNKRMTISDKRNIAILAKDADIIFPLDDDDIFTPDRISNHMNQYDKEDINGYRNLESYIIYGDVFKKSNSCPHNAMSFKKSEWFRVGGYKNDIRIYQDIELHDSITKLKVERDPKNKDFIYHFGGVNYHSCCFTPDEHEAKTGEIAYKQLEKMNLLYGKYSIIPDDEEYNKCMKLKKMFDFGEEEVTIKHISDGKIDISHLL